MSESTHRTLGRGVASHLAEERGFRFLFCFMFLNIDRFH